MADFPRRRWLLIAGSACVAVLLVAVGVAVGIGVEHHRASTPPITAPSSTDVGFAQDMSAHHDQAILMSRSLPSSADAETRNLASLIIAQQLSEVSTLRGWLTWFGQPLTSEHPMSWMTTSGHMHTATVAPSSGDQPPMPGMASVAELAKLTGLSGSAASIFFLQLMIRHHKGGLTMAQAAYNAPDAAPATKQLAMAMIGDQGTEIAQMTLMLNARGAAPLASQ
ncbi:DUF305 domain-containing protein [Gordonia sp. TBRC 11910]|uniref:DUF305 domain-containing protein n=1 Tax=Gordonia asplenii TaxID=2725283 RepID=A0A848KSI1_9ACTN|nr:DUF305 domain-containing protein [Gordonia asplenii]NMO00947.1 DUF305 domain-containing protein [Gordonia asplenii]